MLCRVRFKKLSRAFCSLSDWKATCKPPVPFDGNEQLAEKSCYHFAIKSAVANQKVVISLGLFCPKYHGFFIPTRCRDLWLKQFCLEDIAPAVLIILITHIILAVRWMLIKILSVVINRHGRVNTVVSGGCHPNNNIIRRIDRKIKMPRRFCKRTAKHSDTFSVPPCSLVVVNWSAA